MLSLTAAQSRALDRHVIDALGIPGSVLMENAGRNIAHLLLELGARGPVVVCCGKGNNGGDGFVIARHLDVAGVAAITVAFAPRLTLTGDAAVNHDILVKLGLPLETTPDLAHLDALLASADWVVDALLGSGLTGAVRPPYDAVISRMNAANKRIVAVDIPSGLDADSGRPLGVAVRATVTATVAAPKAGFAHEHARPYVGEVRVVEMGVAAHRLSSAI